MSKKLRQNLIAGVVIYFFCFVFFLKSLKMPDAASLFPQMALGVMAFLNTIMLIMSFKNEYGKNEDGLTWQNLKMPILYFLGIVVYCVLFKFTGYFPGTAIMLIAFFIICKIRPWYLILAITVGYLIFTYILFVVWLKVPLFLY